MKVVLLLLLSDPVFCSPIFDSAGLATEVAKWCAEAVGPDYTTSTYSSLYGLIRFWDTSAVTSMQDLFSNKATCNPDISGWDTSKVTTMAYMFDEAAAFNQPLDNFDTSKVTTMEYMFHSAAAFNQPLDNFDTSQVTNMMRMFSHAEKFNQPLTNFDTSRVTNMRFMFFLAAAFNQPLNSFNTSQVTIMGTMFAGTAFNQPLDNFDTSKVTMMDAMFYNAAAFNQPLDNFDTSKVISMSQMFGSTAAFNQPLDNFDTSRVTHMDSMFFDAASFNQPLTNFDTSQVVNMAYMFPYTAAFNQPLDNFDTSKVTRMDQMFFDAASFNQPLTNFDTSKVTHMGQMFDLAAAFDQNMSTWNTDSVIECSNFCETCALPSFPSCSPCGESSPPVSCGVASVCSCPTLNPTTMNPTTLNPTTVNPTANPNTVNPTANPTTENPTTMNPTTMNPTSNPTMNPTTVAGFVALEEQKTDESPVQVYYGLAGASASGQQSAEVGSLTVIATAEGGLVIEDSEGGGGVAMSAATMAELRGLAVEGIEPDELALVVSYYSPESPPPTNPMPAGMTLGGTVVSVDLIVFSTKEKLRVSNLATSFTVVIPRIESGGTPPEEEVCVWRANGDSSSEWQTSGCVMAAPPYSVEDPTAVSVCQCNHFTDFVTLKLDKEGVRINIGPTSALAAMYSLPLLYSVAILALLAWALGGCWKKGTRMTFFQLLACGCLAFLRMADVSTRAAQVVSPVSSALLGATCHILLVLLWSFVSVSWLSVVMQVRSMRGSFKGLFVTHKKHLFIALLLISLLIVLLFAGAVAADAEEQRSWTVAGTISTALLSFAAAIGFAVSATLLFRTVGGRDKAVGGGKGATQDSARQKVACKVLLVGICMVVSLSGCTVVLLWSGLAEDASQDLMAKYWLYHFLNWISLPAILYLNTAVVCRAKRRKQHGSSHSKTHTGSRSGSSRAAKSSRTRRPHDSRYSNQSVTSRNAAHGSRAKGLQVKKNSVSHINLPQSPKQDPPETSGLASPSQRKLKLPALQRQFDPSLPGALAGTQPAFAKKVLPPLEAVKRRENMSQIAVKSSPQPLQTSPLGARVKIKPPPPMSAPSFSPADNRPIRFEAEPPDASAQKEKVETKVKKEEKAEVVEQLEGQEEISEKQIMVEMIFGISSRAASLALASYETSKKDQQATLQAMLAARKQRKAVGKQASPRDLREQLRDDRQLQVILENKSTDAARHAKALEAERMKQREKLERAKRKNKEAKQESKAS